MLNSLREHNRHRAAMMAWQRKHNRNAPRRGDLAPDFTLGDVSGEHSVTLSQFRGERPVALVFGSFT